MEGTLKKGFFSRLKGSTKKNSSIDNLSKGKINKDYRITEIKSHDEELDNFLFSLGCYEGEMITLISILGGNYIINIKDARYSIDKDLASAIKIEGK
ncbi:ferrous iron transport protein A [Clostridium gasigenes]|uniref:FeoA family protein n=1 Tax=Clostridium gasigenes TaxID=94869 RepID=UPI001C0C6F02|nr:ferrous iron transport protein A [Clostridium gasigenes]MBU3131939.1 ferrous iron transport protein A [Clostridium gasigenes]